MSIINLKLECRELELILVKALWKMKIGIGFRGKFLTWVAAIIPAKERRKMKRKVKRYFAM